MGKPSAFLQRQFRETIRALIRIGVVPSEGHATVQPVFLLHQDGDRYPYWVAEIR